MNLTKKQCEERIHELMQKRELLTSKLETLQQQYATLEAELEHVVRELDWLQQGQQFLFE